MKMEKHIPQLDKQVFEEKRSILIVDDEPLVISALELILERQGYEIYTESNGKKAIESIRKNLPAIIICDQMMPGISGIEVLKQAQQILPDSIRILLTAAVDSKTAIDAINVGHVNQYITKPWNNAELLKVVSESLERYKLVKENRILQDLIFYQHQELQQTHDGLKEELKLGASIHKNLLIGKVPEEIPGISIDAFSFPSKDIDGDFFEFYRPRKQYMDLVLGDVMGKGIAAALVGTAVKTQLIRFAMPFPYQQLHDRDMGWQTNILPPEEILRQVHKEICDELIDLEYFVSLFYCRFDLDFQTMTYIDCGSAKPIHYNGIEKSTTCLTGSGFPLGMVADAEYLPSRISYQKGDIFVFYSDGVTEARDKNNTLFGVERLRKIIADNADLEASELVNIIKEAVIIHSETDKLSDDLTIVAIKVDDLPLAECPKKSEVEFQNDLSQLKEVRKYIRRMLRQAPGDRERLISESELMINEAFSNIVKHGENRSSISIEVELCQDGVSFLLKDGESSFDPMIINEPDFCGTQESGYGWQIIRGLADQLIYAPAEEKNNRNQLCIFKKYYIGENDMQISHEKHGEVLVITPKMESLDAKDAARFKEKVIELINESSSHAVVCDLGHLQFVDSSGLGSLLSVLRELNGRGGDLKLACMSKTIRTMFELVKMHKIFEIYHSTEDAVGSF